MTPGALPLDPGKGSALASRPFFRKKGDKKLFSLTPIHRTWVECRFHRHREFFILKQGTLFVSVPCFFYPLFLFFTTAVRMPYTAAKSTPATGHTTQVVFQSFMQKLIPK